MAKTKQQKQSEVAEVQKQLEQATALVFVNYQGLPVKEQQKLRREVRKNQSDFVVIKKTLLRRALAQASYSDVDVERFVGNVAMGITYGDQAALPKVIADFVKEHKEQMIILGGALNRVFVDAAIVKQLAALPSRDVLLAQIVGSLQAPLSGLVNVLAGSLRNLVGVLSAIQNTKAIKQ